MLGQTLERVTLPDDVVARLEGKSSLGRLGLLIHSTAGFVDAGFSGNLTLELSNVANLPITIYHGMPIGQICFMRMDSPGGARLRLGRDRKQVSGPGRTDGKSLLPEFRLGFSLASQGERAFFSFAVFQGLESFEPPARGE